MKEALETSSCSRMGDEDGEKKWKCAEQRSRDAARRVTVKDDGMLDQVEGCCTIRCDI
jgi:hypothetical protein